MAGRRRGTGGGVRTGGAPRPARRCRGLSMSDLADIDFFRDPSVVADPYPYFTSLREQGPVVREPHHGVLMVTGYREAREVYLDVDTYSSCNSVTGPFATFPVPFDGDDISDVIEKYRDDLPMHDQIICFDPPKHTDHRALLMRLLTPRRLQENEESMWRLADRPIETFPPPGPGGALRGDATPLSSLG